MWVQGKIKSLEQVYLFSLAVKEYQIVDFFLGSALKDEVGAAACVPGPPSRTRSVLGGGGGSCALA